MIAPFFYAAIGLVTGILLFSPRAPLPLTVAWGVVAGAFLLCLFRDPKTRRAAWIGSAAFAAGLGLHGLQLQWDAKLQLLPENLRSARVTLYGRVDGPIERGGRSDRLFLRMERIEKSGVAIPIRSRARLTFYERGLDVRYGDRVRVKGVRLHHPKGFGNPGSFDYEAYLAVRGIAAVGGVSRLSKLTVLERDRGSRVLAALYDVRERLLRTVRSALPPPGAPVLSALLFGERRVVPPKIRSAFYDSGVGHLLAISGLHVGFVALFLYRLLLWMGRWTPRGIRMRMPSPLTPGRLAALGAIPLVLAYMVIAGGRVSTVRATLMVVAYLLARFLQRDRDHFNTLGLAALFILLWDYRFLFDVGFQLSFIAVLVILTCLRHPPPGLSPVRDRVRGFVRVTVLVSVAMVPILAFHFHRVGLYGIAANLALIPLTSLVVPAGLAASVLGTLFPWGADILLYPVRLLLWLLTHGAQWFAALPHAMIRVRPPSPMMLFALYGAAGAWVLLSGRKSLRRLAIGACVAVFGIAVGWNVLQHSRVAKRGELGIFFLDVGNADATFVKLPDGRTLLVDAAGRFSESFDVGEAVVVPFLEKQWVRRLDYALLTHPEWDHAGGLLAVLRSMSVGQLWESGLRSTNPLRDRVLQAAADRAVPLQRFRRGMMIKGRGYRIEVLHPSPVRKAVGYRRDNDQSVILRLVHGKVRVLLASDLERRGERELLRSGEDLRADVLRVPHHGSRTSSSWPFLRRVRPRAAVISAGRPWRGHPSEKVVSRYRSLGAKVFRTDLDGAVRMWSDGETYRLESTRRPRRRFGAKGEGEALTRVAAEPPRPY